MYSMYVCTTIFIRVNCTILQSLLCKNLRLQNWRHDGRQQCITTCFLYKIVDYGTKHWDHDLIYMCVNMFWTSYMYILVKYNINWHRYNGIPMNFKQRTSGVSCSIISLIQVALSVTVIIKVTLDYKVHIIVFNSPISLVLCRTPNILLYMYTKKIPIIESAHYVPLLLLYCTINCYYHTHIYEFICFEKYINT